MPSLAELGWTPAFEQQLEPQERDTLAPGRVFEVQRSGLTVLSEDGARHVPLGGRWFQGAEDERPTVGDWVLLDGQHTIVRLLERHSVLSRVSPSQDRGLQLIAANLDVVFIVTSCNEDFNPSRLERYLALVRNAGVQAVLVLTKRDLSPDPDQYADLARDLDRSLPVELVDARSENDVARLRDWLPPKHTAVLLGSSGVGKSTVVNSLLGEMRQNTRAIREDDGKGRHTTTHRSLHLIPDGGLVLDSPGIRELQLADVESGLETTFEDIERLAQHCQFRDCRHEQEPGCAVRAAIERGQLDARRLANYQKLRREERYNAETIAERHARTRSFDRVVRDAVSRKKHRTRETK